MPGRLPQRKGLFYAPFFREPLLFWKGKKIAQGIVGAFLLGIGVLVAFYYHERGVYEARKTRVESLREKIYETSEDFLEKKALLEFHQNLSQMDWESLWRKLPVALGFLPALYHWEFLIPNELILTFETKEPPTKVLSLLKELLSPLEARIEVMPEVCDKNKPYQGHLELKAPPLLSIKLKLGKI